MTVHVNIGAAKTRLSELVAAAMRGEDIVLDKASLPQVKLVPDPANDLFVSAVTAYEFVDLNLRGRFGADLSLDLILTQLGARVLDYPAAAYRIAQLLPLLHRDPVDRMMVAHAIHSDLTLVSANRLARKYPVRSIW